QRIHRPDLCMTEKLSNCSLEASGLDSGRAGGSGGKDACAMDGIGSPLLYAAFSVFVLGLLALDLGVFHRTAHEVKTKEALFWSAVWIALAAAFGTGVWVWFGKQKALEFATGYLIEKALSVDNIFVFLLLFGSFAVPKAYQHRVLFWGILGALVLRAVFVAAGA